jgi:hypothetical protein
VNVSVESGGIDVFSGDIENGNEWNSLQESALLFDSKLSQLNKVELEAGRGGADSYKKCSAKLQLLNDSTNEI